MSMTAKEAKAQWLKENLKDGEIYAGLILGQDGAPDHHVILIPGEAENITWPKAQEWAKEQGGELPTRREQSLLFANAKPHFQSAWYWSNEQHAADYDYAWYQNFSYGIQLNVHKSYAGRARAVRRLVIL